MTLTQSPLTAARNNVADWVRKYALKGILLLIRRSDPEKQKDNEGSLALQKNQVRHFTRYGIQDFPCEVIDRLETAKEGRERELVDDLIGRMAAGTLGIIVLALGSRLTRSEVDGARLIGAASTHGVLFIVTGEILDPRDLHQHARLMEIIIHARRENAERQYVVAATSYELAAQGDFRMQLPTLLVWVAEDDPRYFKMSANTDYASWVSPEALARHKVRPKRAGVTYYALPDPYPDVFKACSLVAGWTIETRDPREVMQRVRTDPRYPRPGLLPWQPSAQFDSAEPTTWKPATAQALWVWFHSWGLYGVYHYTPKVLRQLGEEHPDIHVEDAWPSVLRSEDRAEVLELISDSRRLFLANGYEGPRNFALARVLCSHPREAGSPCSLRYYATYQKNKPLLYTGWTKGHVGHTRQISADIEGIVIRLVAEAFDPSAVEAAIATLRRGGTDFGPRKAKLRSEIEGASKRIAINVRHAEEAGFNEQAKDLIEYKKRVTELTSERARDMAELARLERDSSRQKQIATDDYERMRALARDIPALLQAARRIEQEEEVRWAATGEFDISRTGLVRRIVSRLVREVHVRQIARGAYHVDVVFRGGEVSSRGLFTLPIKCTQPELAWIAHRDAQGASPAEIATEINAVPGRHAGREALRPWSAARVRNALVRIAYGEASAAAPAGEYCSVQALSERTGVSEQMLVGMGFMGRWGPGRVEDEQMCFCPPLKELDRWLPEYARVRVAQGMGWALDDVAEMLVDQAGTTCGRDLLRWAAASGQLQVARDLWGRRYARISEMKALDVSLEHALENAPEALRALDRSCWLRWEQVQELYPGVSRNTVWNHCSHILRQRRSAWYYVDAAVETALARPTLGAAVAALCNDSLRVDDFYSAVDLGSMLKTRFGCGSYSFVTNHLEGSDVRTVVAWRPAKPRPLSNLYVHVPEAVLAAGFDAVKGWLRGSRVAADDR